MAGVSMYSTQTELARQIVTILGLFGKAPASSNPRLRRLHLQRHPQRRQHRQHFSYQRGRLAGLKINDKPQPDIGGARELVLP